MLTYSFRRRTHRRGRTTRMSCLPLGSRTLRRVGRLSTLRTLDQGNEFNENYSGLPIRAQTFTRNLRKPSHEGQSIRRQCTIYSSTYFLSCLPIHPCVHAYVLTYAHDHRRLRQHGCDSEIALESALGNQILLELPYLIAPHSIPST